MPRRIKRSRAGTYIPIDFNYGAPSLEEQIGEQFGLSELQINALNLERDQYVVECMHAMHARGLINDVERNRVFKRLNKYLETHLTNMFEHDFYGIED